jgi:hypothetical protein
MPKAKFTSEYRIQTGSRIPRLKLDQDEKARVAYIEDPTYKWVHNLRAPKIVDGVAVKETRTKADQKTKYEAFVMKFLGRHECLGDEDTIKNNNGLDEANCPMCAESRRSGHVRRPERRFAMNVLKYKTKPDNWDAVVPVSLEVVVWAFNEGTWGEFLDLVESEEDGPIQGYDLRLTCENEEFQTYKIQSSKKLVWKSDPAIEKMAWEVYENDKTSQEALENLCARANLDTSFMETDLETVRYSWDVANGDIKVVPAAERTLEVDETASLTEGLDLLKAEASNGKAEDPDFSIFASDTEESASGDEDAPGFDDVAKSLGL